jgi:hypothetical protein
VCIYHLTRASSTRSEQLRSMYTELRNFITPSVRDYLNRNSDADMRPCCWQHTSYPCLRLEMTLSPWCRVQVASTILCPAIHSFSQPSEESSDYSLKFYRLQFLHISVSSESDFVFRLTLALLIFGAQLLPLLLNIHILYWLPWRQLLKFMILCTTLQRSRTPVSETTLCVCMGGEGLRPFSQHPWLYVPV